MFLEVGEQEKVGEYEIRLERVLCDVDGWSCELVVLRVDDPPPLSKDADQIEVSVFTWGRMVDRYRDVLFLMTELPVE